MRCRVAIRILAIAAFLIPFGTGTAVSGDEVVRLQAGFQRVFDHVGVTRISVGNPELLEARPFPGGKGVLAVAKKEGETDLVVWDKNGKTERRIEIDSSGDSNLSEAEAFARNFPGVRVDRAGKTILLKGIVATSEDKKLIESYAASHPGVLAGIALPEDGKRLLSYDLKIIELSKGAATQIGVRFPDALMASASWANSPGGLFTIGSQFETRLNMLMADGKARILANPRLVCESGSSADFLAGGEIPIVLITTKTRTVEWKNYGIILKLSPVLKADNSISTHVTVEISTIDHGSGSSDVPAFLTRRVTTSFSTPAGTTVMLSGLVKSETAKDVARVPLLGQIPILGELFKSRSFRDNQTELAIFITPSDQTIHEGDKLSDWEKKSSSMDESLNYRLID